MAKMNDRIVHPTGDGHWANRRVGADRPATVHDTQSEAISSAREMLNNAGGGELTTMGRNGQIRSKDTIGGGNDPCPPLDREH